jgi:hypothetical protein
MMRNKPRLSSRSLLNRINSIHKKIEYNRHNYSDHGITRRWLNKLKTLPNLNLEENTNE